MAANVFLVPSPPTINSTGSQTWIKKNKKQQQKQSNKKQITDLAKITEILLCHVYFATGTFKLTKKQFC